MFAPTALMYYVAATRLKKNLGSSDSSEINLRHYVRRPRTLLSRRWKISDTAYKEVSEIEF